MSKELKVGLFVIVTAILFLATFAYVDELSGVRVPYKAYFRYAGGLDPGSPVRFGGMKVGAITSIRSWREDPTKIEVVLVVKAGVPVNADSVAMMTSLNPLGDRYLEITTGSAEAARLPPGATIPSAEPVSLDDLAQQASALIPTVQSTLQTIQTDVHRTTGNIDVVLANVTAMTGPENQRKLRSLLSNANSLLEDEAPQIDQVLQSLNRASAQATAILSQAGNVLADVQTATQTANAAFNGVNRTVEEIREPIKTDLTELQTTMTEARRLMADLNTVVSVNRPKVDDTLDSFRAASENLRELTAQVKQRPSMLFRGKPTPDRAVPVVAKWK